MTAKSEAQRFEVGDLVKRRKDVTQNSWSLGLVLEADKQYIPTQRCRIKWLHHYNTTNDRLLRTCETLGYPICCDLLARPETHD